MLSVYTPAFVERFLNLARELCGLPLQEKPFHIASQRIARQFSSPRTTCKFQTRTRDRKPRVDNAYEISHTENRGRLLIGQSLGHGVMNGIVRKLVFHKQVQASRKKSMAG